METLVYVVASLAAVAVFAAVVGRLLGVRLSAPRSVLAAVLALALGRPVLEAMVAGRDLSPGAFAVYLALTVCIAAVIAMLALVVAEIVVPSGSVPGMVEVVRGWRARSSRSKRYLAIVRGASGRGLGRFMRTGSSEPVDARGERRAQAAALRETLDEAGATFVKLGQQLAARRDLLPEEFTDELSQLRDDAAPVPWPQVAEQIEQELGRDLTDVFLRVEREPLAAASVAQVHAAVLRTGEDVVVKVQRPGIDRTVEQDLDIIARLARTLENRTRWARELGARALAEGFAEALREELDFTVEADNLRSVAAALPDVPRGAVRVPEPHTELCTSRLLVMERLWGTPLTRAEGLLDLMARDQREAMAGTLLDTVLDQVLTGGVVHVDLHPGNVLVDAEGRLGLLDLGSVARVDRTTREGLAQLLAAVGREDSRAATDALLELLDRPDVVDERALERALGSLILRYTAPGGAAGASAFSALVALVSRHGLGVPADVAAVFRALATLEGTIRVIAPGFDLAARTRTSGHERLAEALSPRRVLDTVEEEVGTWVPLLRRLPRRVDRVADTLEHGRLQVNVRLLADHRDRAMLTGLIHQVLLTVLAAATGLMSALLLRTDSGPSLAPDLTLHSLVGYGLLIASLVLGLRVLILVLRRDPTATHR